MKRFRKLVLETQVENSKQFDMYSVIYDDIINLFLSTNRDYCLFVSLCIVLAYVEHVTCFYMDDR